jgi:hypothetical protein
MRYIIYISCASAMLLAGCATTPDPITRLSAALSKTDGGWQGGITPMVPLPSNAPTEQVIAKEFEMPANMPAISYKILKTRQVHIKGDQPDLYTAVLVQTDTGEKIALIRYVQWYGQMSGWWVRFYDTRTLAWTGTHPE